MPMLPEANSSEKTNLPQLILAQSRAIDAILARLKMLEPGFAPAAHFDWPAIKQAREIADQVERQNHGLAAA